MAFLDDVYMASDPDRVGPAYATVQDSLWEEAGIRIHVGKTRVEYTFIQKRFGPLTLSSQNDFIQ